MFDDVTFTAYGFEKIVHIWKPEDYDASSDEKYSTIYVLDGQYIADFGLLNYEPMHCPGVIEQTRTAMSQTGKKAIIVAIDNYLERDCELTPELEYSVDDKENERMKSSDSTDSEYDSMTGSQIAYFLANMLVPYVQQNYNVYTDALHTSITGNSLGGLEAFYIGLEYPDTFGTVGAMSPSFWLFEEPDWSKYLEKHKKSFSDNLPLMYLYTGPAGEDTDPEVTNMYNRLKDMGYPEDKLVLHFNENGTHSHLWWRSVFSEFLTAMFYQNVETLQQ